MVDLQKRMSLENVEHDPVISGASKSLDTSAFLGLSMDHNNKPPTNKVNGFYPNTFTTFLMDINN